MSGNFQSAAHVEIEVDVNSEIVEIAHRKAILAQRDRRQNFADTGYRAALARDARLLKVLEKATEVVDKMQEEQYGRTMRAESATYSESKGTTEAQLWREAYRLCDQGDPIRNFEWIYGAAAWICGYNT